MLTELPTLNALMTTEHAPTIQDGSEPFWKLAGSDLFLLASTDGRALGFHVTQPGFEPSTAVRDLDRSLDAGEDRHGGTPADGCTGFSFDPWAPDRQPTPSNSAS